MSYLRMSEYSPFPGKYRQKPSEDEALMLDSDNKKKADDHYRTSALVFAHKKRSVSPDIHFIIFCRSKWTKLLL